MAYTTKSSDGKTLGGWYVEKRPNVQNSSVPDSCSLSSLLKRIVNVHEFVDKMKGDAPRLLLSRRHLMAFLGKWSLQAA